VWFRGGAAQRKSASGLARAVPLDGVHWSGERSAIPLTELQHGQVEPRFEHGAGPGGDHVCRVSPVLGDGFLRCIDLDVTRGAGSGSGSGSSSWSLPASAASAEGSKKLHEKRLEKLYSQLFSYAKVPVK
jgi:hypothetical protein